jgi:hypothetical protein
MPTDIRVSIQGGQQAEGGYQHFEPGGDIWGSVTVTPDRDLKCNHLWVRLQWHTEGRGDRDQGRVDEADVFQGTLSANQPVRHDFRFQLPDEPWSFAGHYVNIVWEVVGEIDVPMALDLRGATAFILAPKR